MSLCKIPSCLPKMHNLNREEKEGGTGEGEDVKEQEVKMLWPTKCELP